MINSLNIKEVKQKNNSSTVSSSNNENKKYPLIKKSNFNAFLEKVDINSLKRQSTGLKSHRNSIFLQNYDGMANKIQTPIVEKTSSPQNLFSNRKKSIPNLQTHLSNVSPQLGPRKKSINMELDLFLKNYSQNINLRRLSESTTKKNIKDNPYFNSPLIKNIKRAEVDIKVKDSKIVSENEKPHKRMSPFRKTIKSLLSTFVNKKISQPNIEKKLSNFKKPFPASVQKMQKVFIVPYNNYFYK
jgi:hypothetical protein